MTTKKTKTKSKKPAENQNHRPRKIYTSIEEWAKDFERQKQEQDKPSWWDII